MESYDVRSSDLLAAKRYLQCGDWRKAKPLLKAAEDNQSLSQVEKCFVFRFIGEHYASEKKFEAAVRAHERYLDIATGHPVEEQRAHATLGATLLDQASRTLPMNEDLRSLHLQILKEAQRHLQDALRAVKRLWESKLVTQQEAGAMIMSGLLNIGFVEKERGNDAGSVVYLEKAVRAITEYKVGNCAAAQQLDVHYELAEAYRVCHRYSDLWDFCTKALQVADKFQSIMCRKAHNFRLYVLELKAKCAISTSNVDLAIRLIDEALKACRSLKNRKDVEAEDDLFSESQDGKGRTDEHSLLKFRQLCKKICKINKKIQVLSKPASGIVPENNIGIKKHSSDLAKLYEKVADRIFDLELFELAQKLYEKSLSALVGQKVLVESNQRSNAIIVSIGQCCLKLGSFDAWLTKLRSDCPRSDLLIAVLEAATDHYLHSSNITTFEKFLKEEFEARDTFCGEAQILARLGEIRRSIDAVERFQKELLEAFRRHLVVLKIEESAFKDHVVLADDSDVESAAKSSSSEDDTDENDSDGGKDTTGAHNGRKRSGRSSLSSFVPTKIRRNEKGETKLHIACRKGDVEAAKALVLAGHPVNAADGSGWLPLHDATDDGNVETVALLLKHGADTNVQNDVNGLTPLMEAAKNCHLEKYRQVLRLLVNRGANCDIRDKGGRAAIFYFHQSRRENERTMSADDLAEWVDLEELILSKMKKPPPKFTRQYAPKKKDEAGRPGSVASWRSHSTTTVANPSGHDKTKTKDAAAEKPAVDMYRTAMASVGRAKSPKKEDTFKPTKPKATVVALIEQPFFEGGQNDEFDENAWLIDDIGMSKKGKSQASKINEMHISDNVSDDEDIGEVLNNSRRKARKMRQPSPPLLPSASEESEAEESMSDSENDDVAVEETRKVTRPKSKKSRVLPDSNPLDFENCRQSPIRGLASSPITATQSIGITLLSAYSSVCASLSISAKPELESALSNADSQQPLLILDLSNLFLSNLDFECVLKTILRWATPAARLSTLRLSGNCFDLSDSRAARYFVDVLKCFPSLVEVDFSVGQICGAGIAQISTWLRGGDSSVFLERLNLSFNSLILPYSPEGSRISSLEAVCSLLRSPLSKSLRSLNLASCSLGSDAPIISSPTGLIFGSESTVLAYLRELDLSYNQLDSSNFNQLAKYSHLLPKLAVLRLNGSVKYLGPPKSSARMDSKVILTILQSFQCLEELHIANNGLSDDDIIGSFTTKSAKSLIVLNLAENTLSQKSLLALCSTSVRKLDVRGIAGIRSPLQNDVFDALSARQASKLFFQELCLSGKPALSEDDLLRLTRILKPTTVISPPVDSITNFRFVTTESLPDYYCFTLKIE